MLDSLSSSPVHYGSEPIPSASGRFGILDSMRIQEAASPGMALSYEDSATGSKYLNIYKFGNALARKEFLGVLVTKGSSPTLAVTASSTNADTVSILFDGICPCLLAPGFACRAGQFLEPIPSGTYQAQFRPVQAGGRGPVMALEAYDNSAGTAGQWVSSVVKTSPVGVGVVGAITTSSAALSANAETAFDQSVSVPIIGGSNAQVLGRVFRIRAKVRVTDGAAAETLILRLRWGGLTGALLAATGAITVATGDLGNIDVVMTVRSTTTATASGHISLGVPGTATARSTGTAGTVTIDTTAATTVVATADWSADSTNDVILEDLVVEALN